MKRKENDCLLLKALIAQNQINSKLFESESNITSDSMNDAEIDLVLANLKHAITSMASHFLLANTLMSAALVAASYINIARIKC